MTDNNQDLYLLDLAMDSIEDAIIWVDPEYRVIYCNDGAGRMFAEAPDEVVDTFLLEQIPTLCSGPFRQAMDEFVRSTRTHLKISKADETDMHLLSTRPVKHNQIIHSDCERRSAPCRANGSSLALSGPILDEKSDLARFEKLLGEVFLIFQLFTQSVEHGAALSFLRIASEHKTETYLINHRAVLVKTTPQLQEQLVLMLITIRSREDARHAVLNQSLECAFEESV